VSDVSVIPAAAPGSSSQDELNSALVEKARVETRKADLEAQLLQHQLAPAHRRLEFYKGAATASGLLIALVSLFGAFGSVGTWFVNQSRERDIRIEERLERALTGLSDPSPQRRATSLALLRSFATGTNERHSRQVILAVAEALPLESSPLVANSIVSFLGQLQGVGHGPLAAGLNSLAEKSRRLLGNERAKTGGDAVAGAQLALLASGMTALLRAGARGELAGVDLSGADLSGLELNGQSFKGALLKGASFANAKAARADFADADLWQANFRGADLAGANFAQPARGGPMQHDLMRRVAERPDGTFGFPDFSCANLRGADFTWHPLIFVPPASLNTSTDGASPRFAGANLEGANLERLMMLGLGPANSAKWPFPTSADSAGGSVELGNGLALAQMPIDPKARLAHALPNAPEYPHDYSPFAATYSTIRDAFRAAHWKDASLPHAVREVLGNRYLPRGNDQPGCKAQQ
jgi:hypothetical protein